VCYCILQETYIYLAGPFFSSQEILWVSQVCQSLETCGFKVLSPSRENGIIAVNTDLGTKKQIFSADIELLEKSDLVVALLDHNDTGTCFEIGYAFNKHIPIIGLRTSCEPMNNMIFSGCTAICDSIQQVISEVYKIAK